MDKENIIGYDDQEVLLQALVAYASSQISRSQPIVKGLMRQSINEWVIANQTSLKDINFHDQEDRFRAFDSMIDNFLNKIKHIVVSRFFRRQMKLNAISIWIQWEKTRRNNPEINLNPEIEGLVVHY